MLRRLLLLLPWVVGCVDFDKPPAVDPNLERRIAQKLTQVAAAPADATAETELAELYFEAERYFDAADHFQAASTKSGDITRVASGLALTYLELGYIPAMVEQLKRCFERNRSHPGCLYAFGNLLERDGSPDALAEARRTYLHFLQVAPPDHPRLAYVKSAVEQLNARLPKEALEAPPDQPASAPAPAGNPAMPPNHPTGAPPGLPAHGAATGEEDVGELNEFGRAIQKGMSLAQSGDFANAEAAFRQAVSLVPTDAGARAGLAEMLYAQRKRGEARQAVEEAWKLDRADPQVRYTYGLIMLEEPGKKAEALAAWEALVAAEPEYAEQLKLKERIAAAKGKK